VRCKYCKNWHKMRNSAALINAHRLRQSLRRVGSVSGTLLVPGTLSSPCRPRSIHSHQYLAAPSPRSVLAPFLVSLSRWANFPAADLPLPIQSQRQLSCPSLSCPVLLLLRCAFRRSSPSCSSSSSTHTHTLSLSLLCCLLLFFSSSLLAQLDPPVEAPHDPSPYCSIPSPGLLVASFDSTPFPIFHQCGHQSNPPLSPFPVRAALSSRFLQATLPSSPTAASRRAQTRSFCSIAGAEVSSCCVPRPL
jgi:hypothetical protein